MGIMTTLIQPTLLHNALENLFGVNGPPQLSRWEDIADRDKGHLLRAIEEVRKSTALNEALLEWELCWNLVENPLLESRIRLSYPGSSPALACRLAGNARRLVACTGVALAARHLCQGAGGTEDALAGWTARAVGAPVLLADSPRSITTPEPLIRWLFSAHTAGNAVTPLTVWTLWCLDDSLPTVWRIRRVPYVAITSGFGEIDSIKLSLLDLPYAGLIEDPKSALVPLEESWLDGLEGAWSAGAGVDCERAVKVTVTTRARGRVLKGKSAGGGIAVGLRCLLRGVPYDGSRLILASVQGGSSATFAKVGSIPEKLEAAHRHGAIRHVAVSGRTEDAGAVGESQQSYRAEDIPEVISFLERFPDSKISVSVADTLERAFSFATEHTAAVHKYLRHIQERPFGADPRSDFAIDPYVVEVDSTSGGMTADSRDVGDRRTDMEGHQRTPYRAFTQSLFEGASSYALITAPPGYGKTLLAHRIACQIATDACAAFETGRASLEDTGTRLVLPLEADALLELAAPAVNSEAAAAAARKCLVAAGVATYGLGAPVFEFLVERACSPDFGNSVVILIDALDRLSSEQRSLLASVLNSVVRWPCHVVFTTRHAPPHIHRSATAHYEIASFSVAQIRQFIQKRFSNDPSLARRLLDAVRRNPSLARSASVPQVLGWLCDVFEGDTPPSTRASIFEGVISKLAANHPSSTDRSPDTLMLLEDVAREWWFAAEGRGVASQEELREWIGRAMGESLPARVTPSLSKRLTRDQLTGRWLEQLVEMGVIVPTASDGARLGWVHDSIQQGLAAMYTARLSNDEPERLDLVDGRTRELLPLVSGYRADPSPIIEALLEGPDPFHRRLMLAADCLAECDPADQSRSPRFAHVAARVLDRLTAVLLSQSFSDRDRAAEAVWRCAAWCDDSFKRHLEGLLSQPLPPAAAAAVAEALIAAYRPELSPAALRFLAEGRERGRARAVRRLGMLTDSRLPELLSSLVAAGSPEVQLAAIEALAGQGTDEAVEALIHTLENSTEWCRSGAASALSMFSDDVSERLWKMAADGLTPHGRAAAVEALSMAGLLWGREGAAGAVTGLEVDKSHIVRGTVATVLGTAPEAFATPSLLRLCRDSNPNVRARALASLARVGAVGAAEHVESMLEDSVEYVRIRAAATLVRLGVVAHEQFLIERTEGGAAGKEALVALVQAGGPRLRELLANLVRDPSRLRVQAVRALARLGDRGSVPGLLELLAETTSESERLACAEALGMLGAGEATGPLLALLSNHSLLVSSAAAEALGRIGATTVVRPLVRCLASEDPRLRHSARGALAMLGLTAEVYDAALAEGLPIRGRMAVDLYEALWRGVELTDAWDFGGHLLQLDELTSVVTRGAKSAEQAVKKN